MSHPNGHGVFHTRPSLHHRCCASCSAKFQILHSLWTFNGCSQGHQHGTLLCAVNHGFCSSLCRDCVGWTWIQLLRDRCGISCGTKEMWVAFHKWHGGLSHRVLSDLSHCTTCGPWFSGSDRTGMLTGTPVVFMTALPSPSSGSGIAV